ncbi:hypothetical protein Q3G72_001431 [Acer saccharum]|nr:hypothetical protein Q3G72_001431 [Acer saccharum]
MTYMRGRLKLKNVIFEPRYKYKQRDSSASHSLSLSQTTPIASLVVADRHLSTPPELISKRRRPSSLLVSRSKRRHPSSQDFDNGAARTKRRLFTKGDLTKNRWRESLRQ